MLMQDTPSTAGRSFDLTEIVEWERKGQLWSSMIQACVATAVGVLLFGVGVYVGFLRAPTITPIDWYAGLALPACGVILIVGVWTTPGRVRRGPNLVVVSDAGLEYGYNDGKSLKTLRWDDSRLKFRMHDARAVAASVGGRYKFSPFSLFPTGTLRIPINESAFEAILEASARHNLAQQRAPMWGLTVLTFTQKRKSP
jgi:hypothetical protein